MSGTSLDGIDVAIVEIRGRRVATIGFQSTPYAEATSPRHPRRLERHDHHARNLAAQFPAGRTVCARRQRACRRYGPVELIGCHGQTIYHEGGASTLQIGEAAVIAERTGVPVVSDFRTRDIAAGGQGAPLVPFVDCLLFGHPRRTRVALNIGGIANITVMPAGIAFDTGPGNMVIDALVREYTSGRQRFDRDGRIAAQGNLNRPLLDRLLADPYYRRKPPKTRRPRTIRRGIRGPPEADRPPAPGPDRHRHRAHRRHHRHGRRAVRTRPKLIVSGGGAHNPQILAHLAAFLPGVALATSADYGIDVGRQRSHRLRHPGVPNLAPQAFQSAVRHRRPPSGHLG